MLSRALRKLHHLCYLQSTLLGARVLGLQGVVRRLERAPPAVVPNLLRRFGASVGEGVSFSGGVIIENAVGDLDARGDLCNLRIGPGCYVGRGVSFDLPDLVEIEDEVVLASGVTILTHSDCGQRAMARWYPRRRAPVRVGKGSWLGVRAIILPGVELGECCVVGAGAVVTRSFPSRRVLAGSPAREIGRLDEESEEGVDASHELSR